MRVSGRRARRVPIGLVAVLLVSRAACWGQTLQVHLELDGDLVDSSGNGRDGALVEGPLGTASFEEAPVGDGLKLEHDDATLTTDRTDGAYVAIPYRLTEDGTVALWYRTSPFYNYQSIWDNSGNQDDFEMWIYSDGRLRARVDGNVGQVTHTMEGFNEWHHITYTWSRGDQARLYVDGVERDLDSNIRAISEAAFDAALLGDEFYLGGGNAGNTFGAGTFDDLRIYDGVLPAADIQALFEAGEPPVEGEDAELLLHWEFEEDEGDSSGNDNDGELVFGALGDFSYIDGPVGKALKLEHDLPTLTSDTLEGAYVSVPFILPEEGSIVLWYRADTFYNYQTIFDNSGNQDDFEMWIYDDGRLRARIDGNVGQVTQQLSSVFGTWYHIAYTWKRGDQARLYVDGEERDAASGIRAVSEDQFDAAILGDMFYIGGGNPGNAFGIGAWDDVRIYEGVLSQESIQALMDQGDPPEPPEPPVDVEPGELTVHLKLDGDTSDATGSGNDGELIVGLLGSVDWIPGPVGQALKLNHDPETLKTDFVDGAYVAIPYTLTENGTIMLWYRPEPYYNYQSIFDNSGNRDDFEMWIYDDGRLRARIDGNVGQVTQQLETPGEWVHIAYSWVKGDAARLWVNGEERDLDSPIRAIGDIQFDTAILGDTVFLGGGNPGNLFGIGALDDFRIYDGPVSEEEIRAIMNEGEPPEPPEVEPEDPGEAVVHWRLDGDLVNDGSLGPDYDGELVEGAGEVSYVTARAGEGLSLDNGAGPTPMTAGSYVRVQNPLTDEGTITLWYYARPWYNYQTIFDNSTDANDWEMWIYDDGRLRVRIDGGSGQATAALESLGGPDQWYHIAYAWDRNEQDEAARLYINGELIGSDAIPVWIEPGEFFYLGGGNDGNTYGNGIWDDVRIYDFALSHAEVLFTMQDSTVERTLFRRGDVDDNGEANLTDAVNVLSFLFAGGGAPVCFEAADTDNNREVNLTDAVALLTYLFDGGEAPAAPGALECGEDPDEESFDCTYTSC